MTNFFTPVCHDDYPKIEGMPLDRDLHIDHGVTIYLNGKREHGRLSHFTQSGKVYVKVDGERNSLLVDPAVIRWGWL